MSKSIRQDLEKENSAKFDLMSDELQKRSDKVKDFNKILADNERLKLEKAEAISNVDLEVSKKLNKVLGEEKLKIQNSVESEFELRIKQLQKQLKDQKTLSDEQQRKLNQGSMQLQGEAQELAIEEWLRLKFPMDEVIEIKKGANGADCIHHVKDKGFNSCGTIYYESKNTKSFNNKWIHKFKSDMKEKNMDLGVIVTKTLPKEMKRMGLFQGIYICTYNEFKGLCVFLRDFLVHISRQKVVDNNKGDKTTMLYKYINSKEFKSNLQTFVETFKIMSNQLDDEIKKSTINFEKRRGSLDLLKNNIFSITGRFSGIIGTTLLEDSSELLDRENSFNLLSLFHDEPPKNNC